MTGRIPDGFDAHVLVVGAGPTGLLLAAELRLGGASVIVLEAESAPSTESRATILSARTIEILDSRGLLPQLGEVVNESRSHFGGIPFDLGSTPQWYVPQPVTERVLRDWGLELGVDLRWRHRVDAIEVAADGVTVRTTDGARLRALCVVGCDGQHSTVRRLSTAGFPEPAQPRELIRADVAGVDIPNRRFQRLPNGLAVAARRPDGRTRVMVHRFGQLARPRTGAPEFAELVETWRQVTGEDLSGGTLCWINAFDDAQQQLSRYRHGRVILAGDAAHQQLQVGGQALNLALQDAFNLGWKLALHVTGRAGPGLLDSYSDERYAADRAALTNIEAQAMLLIDG
ncbi:MAG TPA: FAD-dependent monooxygenase, partial [Jatrophihabitans sp.]|nr:FAD-dependent monooxygenase [Jatrophihabitans sp.]